MIFGVGWTLTVPVFATERVELPRGVYYATTSTDTVMRLLVCQNPRDLPKSSWEFEDKSLECINHEFEIKTDDATVLVCRGSMFAPLTYVQIKRRA